MAADFSRFHLLLRLAITSQTSDATVRTDAGRGIYLGYSDAISLRRSILTNLIFERGFLLFPHRFRSHSAMDDTMAADFSRSHRLLRQTITLQTSDTAAVALGFEATSEGSVCNMDTELLLFKLQTLTFCRHWCLLLMEDIKRSASAEGYEVGFEEHCKWPT